MTDGGKLRRLAEAALEAAPDEPAEALNINGPATMAMKDVLLFSESNR